VHPITPCSPYAARPAGQRLHRVGPAAFKVYYVDIPGRAEPHRFEWEASGLGRDRVLRGLDRVGAEGVGFVCAFPHITKVFRFAPSLETVMHVKAYHTPDFSGLDLSREDGYLEFACLAEAILADGEYRLWAAAGSVEEYLAQWVDWSPTAIRDHQKLARHYDALAPPRARVGGGN
jgi:hypothetical protein